MGFFVFKSFVDNCLLFIFVSTERGAEDAAKSNTEPVHPYPLLRTVKEGLK